MKPITLFVSICLLMQMTYSISQAQTEFTLQQAVDYAILHSNDLRNVQLDAQITEERNKEVTGSALPQVSAGTSFQYNYQIPTTLLPGQIVGLPEGTLLPVKFSQKFGFGGNLQLNQLLFEPSVFVGLKAREAFIQLSEIKINQSIQVIKSNINKAYYSVLIGYKRKQLVDINIDLLNAMLNTTQATYTAGFAEQLDVDKIQVQVNNLQWEKLKTENFIKNTIALLKYQMNYPQEDTITLLDSISSKDLDNMNQILAQEITFDNTNDYQMLQTSMSLGDFDIMRYKYSYYPTVALFANYGFNAPTNEFNYFSSSARYFPQGALGFSISMPIFKGGSTKAKISQAKYSRQKLDNNFNMMYNSYKMQNETLKNNFRNAILTLENQKKNMALAKKVYDKTKIKYETGVGSSIEVIQANTELQKAQTDFYTSMYEAILAKIDILNALNQL